MCEENLSLVDLYIILLHGSWKSQKSLHFFFFLWKLADRKLKAEVSKDKQMKYNGVVTALGNLISCFYGFAIGLVFVINPNYAI